jgi:hypothetical protein
MAVQAEAYPAQIPSTVPVDSNVPIVQSLAVQAEAYPAQIPSTVPVDCNVPILYEYRDFTKVRACPHISNAEHILCAVPKAVQEHIRISRVHQVAPVVWMNDAVVGRQIIPRTAKTNYAPREEARKVTDSLKINKRLVSKSFHPVKNYNQYDSLSHGVQHIGVAVIRDIEKSLNSNVTVDFSLAEECIDPICDQRIQSVESAHSFNFGGQ